MTAYAITILVLSAMTVWDMLSNRASFAARFAQSRGFAISVASVFWIYAVETAGVPLGLMVLLKAPAIVALACVTWTLAWAMWKSWRAARHA